MKDPGLFALDPPSRTAVLELDFHANARHVRVLKSLHDQHDLGDDETRTSQQTGG